MSDFAFGVFCGWFGTMFIGLFVFMFIMARRKK